MLWQINEDGDQFGNSGDKSCVIASDSVQQLGITPPYIQLSAAIQTQAFIVSSSAAPGGLWILKVDPTLHVQNKVASAEAFWRHETESKNVFAEI